MIENEGWSERNKVTFGGDWVVAFKTKPMRMTYERRLERRGHQDTLVLVQRDRSQLTRSIGPIEFDRVLSSSTILLESDFGSVGECAVRLGRLNWPPAIC
jgi:hypothetical protein